MILHMFFFYVVMTDTQKVTKYNLGEGKLITYMYSN